MNARLFLAALFFGAFFLAFCLILALWPNTDEPEPTRVVSRHAVNIAGASTFYDSLTTTTTAPPTTTTARARTAPTRPPREVRVQTVGDRVDLLAACESNMNQRAYNPAGPFFSYFQWLLPTWQQAGGTGHPYDAPYAVQKRLAIAWAAKTSWASQWPVCSRQVGLAS